MVRIQILQESGDLQRIAGEWEALVEDSFTATFSRPPWHLAWLEAFPPKRIALVTARESGRLVGILPLALIRSDIRGLFLPLVVPLARGDYQPPIVEPAVARDALPAMLDAAVRHFGQHVVYWFANIPANDPALQILSAYFQSTGMAHLAGVDVAPRIRIGGRSYAELEAQWSPKHRKEVRQKRRRLESLGTVRLWQPRTLDEASSELEEFFAVHDEKWLAQGQPGRFRDPAYRRHYLAILRRLWGRGLHFSALRCGSTNIYYSFSFVSGGWILLYRPASRIAYQKYSPGTGFLSVLLEEACRAGMQGIDFLAGDEEFKFRWSNEVLQVVGIHAAARAWSPAFQWFARARPYVVRHLEPSMARVKARWQRGDAHRASPQTSGA